MNDLELQGYLVVKIKYHGPTNTKGSRFSVTIVGDNQNDKFWSELIGWDSVRKYFPKDYELDGLEEDLNLLDRAGLPRPRGYIYNWAGDFEQYLYTKAQFVELSKAKGNSFNQDVVNSYNVELQIKEIETNKSHVIK